MEVVDGTETFFITLVGHRPMATPVEMTILLQNCSISQATHGLLKLNKIVISTGGIMGLRPTRGNEKRLGPATTLYGTVALSFVIPSEAEGSAVPRTLPGYDLRFLFTLHVPMGKAMDGAHPSTDQSRR
jgi:hypothetical protein